MTTLSQHIESIRKDAEILLTRALVGKKVNAFGADGQGSAGRHDIPQFFTINKVHLFADTATEGGKLAFFLQVFPEGYLEERYENLIFDDRNFQISINKLLQDELIDPTALTLLPLGEQSDCSVCYDLDVSKLHI